MNFPAELKYTRDHEWVKIEGDKATIGITDFAQRELGDIVFVDITSEGEEVAKEETFGSVEAVKTVSDLYMPVTGTVTEVNGELNGNPELVNKDPYGAGWIIKIDITDSAQLADLLDATAYEQLVGA